jgi:SAM-dependent methyltransferase
MSPAPLHVPSEFCRNAGSTDDLRDDEASVNSGAWLLDHMCEHLGVPDLGELEVLDFGCGVRFAQTIVNRALAIKRYVGVDVYRDMIDFLVANVGDPRLEFLHLDAHNDRYNPTGRPLAVVADALPIERNRFDLICLFSVFTHLAPHDYGAMLRVLRRFVRPTGRLFFTLFINEKTEGGHGLMDTFGRALVASSDSGVKAAIASRARSAERPGPPDFLDLDPRQPLLFAVYSRRHALELIEGTGWEVLSVSDPGIHLQHHIVCAPS